MQATQTVKKTPQNPLTAVLKEKPKSFEVIPSPWTKEKAEEVRKILEGMVDNGELVL